MASPHGFFSPRSLNYSNAFSTTNNIGSEGHRVPIHQQQRLLFEAQQRNTMVDQEHLRQPHFLAPSLFMKPWTDAPNYYPCYVDTAYRIPSIMPQPYAIDGRERIGAFAPITNPTHVGVNAQPITNHLVIPKHASSNTVVGHHHQKLKRKTMTIEVPHGPSTNVVLDSTRNVFSFDKNYQEAQKHITNKKNTNMTLSLLNENDADDVAERAARAIPFFPLSVKHALPNSDSEFYVYEMSFVFGGGSDVELDLSLKLSSSSSKSALKVDLSLKL